MVENRLSMSVSVLLCDSPVRFISTCRRVKRLLYTLTGQVGYLPVALPEHLSMTEKDRRAFIKAAAGVTVIGTLAGCSGDGEETEGDETGTDAATDTEMESMDTESETMSGDTETESMETETMGEGTETESMGQGRLRVAHMSPNAPNVDVYLDGEAVLEDVQYTNVSDYLPVPAGDHTVAITAAGDSVDSAVFEGTVTVGAKTDYTVAALGEVGEDGDKPFEPLVLEDDNSDPGGNDARARIVHASPDAPAVDVTAGEGTVVLVDGLEYRGTATSTIQANDYTVEIRPDTESNDGDVVHDEDLSLNGGTVYTVFAAGYLTPDDDPSEEAFDLVVAQDASY